MDPIERAADEFVEEYGEDAVEVLRSRGNIASKLGNPSIAETWLKTADVITLSRIERHRTKPHK